MDDLIRVGYLSKTVGYKGANILAVEDGIFLTEEHPIEFLFLNFEEKPVPFAIEKFEVRANGVMVQFEDINTEVLAKDIVGRTVFAKESDVEREEGFVDFSVLIGFKVTDAEKGSIGEVVGVLDNGPNIVLELDFEGKEIMLPYSEDLIEAIDEEEGVIYYEAPEGLIDMYLE